jgi:hypothetical protein
MGWTRPAEGGFAGVIHHHLRGLMEAGSCLTHPQEVMARPGFRELALSFAGEPVPAMPGPDRDTLVTLAAG